MRRITWLLLSMSALFISPLTQAAVTCNGTIEEVYKWHHMERLSIKIGSTNRWINMPTKTDEAMALMAFAAKKTVSLYWAANDVNSCQDGWDNNRKLDGYWVIKQ